MASRHVSNGARVSPASELEVSQASEQFIEVKFPKIVGCRQNFSYQGIRYDSDDFIELNFSRDEDTHQARPNSPERNGHHANSQPAERNEDHYGNYECLHDSRERRPRVRGSSVQLLTGEFRETMDFPRVSEAILRVEIEDFYTALTVGLDALQRSADSEFLSASFLYQCVDLLTNLDHDVLILIKKLADLRHPESAETQQVVEEYRRISGHMLSISTALRFTMTLMKAYLNSQVNAAVRETEALVALDRARASNVVKAKDALVCLNACRLEMSLMMQQVKSVVESELLGGLLYTFIPSLDLKDGQTESDFSKWTGLWGVLFAVRTAAAYICQLLLVAYCSNAGDGGPVLLVSTNVASFHSGWASSLVSLHNHSRTQFNRMKDERRLPCAFMTRDTDVLETMLQSTREHLESLLDKGKFLNMGPYVGSWKVDKKNLTYNTPLLRSHFRCVSARLYKLTRNMECLRKALGDGQFQLSQL